MTAEAIALRQLADAIEQLNRVKHFDTPVPPESVRVEWRHGSALPGYDDLRVELSYLVGEMYPELRQRAIERAELRVFRARKELAAIQAENEPGSPA